MTNTDTPLQTLIEAFKLTLLDDHCEPIDNALNYYQGSNDAGEFIDYFSDTYIHTAEVIYYHKAMEFLLEHDASLATSIELAHEYGYETEAINSELLATLLLQQMLSEELHDLDSDLEDYFEALEALESEVA